MSGYLLQTESKPLYPDLIWSRPENKLSRGKVLIIGGQTQEFFDVATAYKICQQAGAGHINILMPISTRNYTKHLEIEYAPSNKSGSFERTALASLLDAAQWADSVLLAGNLGKNSETNLMLDEFIMKCPAHLIISSGALESVTAKTSNLINQNVSLILNFNQAQKILSQQGRAISSSNTHNDTAQILHEFTKDTELLISFLANGQNKEIWTSQHGQVALTKINENQSSIELAAKSAVWAAQNPKQIFKSVCSSIIAS